MEKEAGDMRLAPQSGDGQERSFSAGDLDAARELAEFHRLLAAELPPGSQVRGLVLRCAGHWSRLGAIPRNGLQGLERDGD